MMKKFGDMCNSFYTIPAFKSCVLYLSSDYTCLWHMHDCNF